MSKINKDILNTNARDRRVGGDIFAESFAYVMEGQIGQSVIMELKN